MIRKIFDSARDFYGVVKGSIQRKLNREDIHVPSLVKQIRKNFCSECPSYMSTTDMCVECFCKMEIKSGLAEAECPLGKWKKHP